jgi:serine/threonine-protein kinase haspin
LSIDLSELNLDHDSFTDHETPEYLKPLLEECHQLECGPHNFSGFIESFPYDLILQSARDSGAFDMSFKKIGEASYSEVFGIGDVVLKIIPLCDESQTNVEEVDGPAPTNAKDVRKEIIVTRAMCEVYSGFVKLMKTYVVRGRYPEVLLRLWDEYNERKGSESVRPGEKALL